jgi:hypothetical protein
MLEHRAQQYRLAVEWHDPFAGAGQPDRGLVFYTITLRPEVTPEDFETFVKAELAPAVGGISTRRFDYGPVYLLAETGETIPLDPLGSVQRAEVAKRLESLSTHTLDHRYLMKLGPGSLSAD